MSYDDKNLVQVKFGVGSNSQPGPFSSVLVLFGPISITTADAQEPVARSMINANHLFRSSETYTFLW